MIFRPKGKKEGCPTIHINGSNIQKLIWIEHIKCISRKIAKGTCIIIKARKSFESESLLNLDNALIFPHITYGIHVWRTAAAVHLHRLHLFQKKKCSYRLWRTHTDPLYKNLKILNIDQTSDYSIALFMYKLSHRMLPSMFENVFIYTSDVHDYHTRQADLLYIQSICFSPKITKNHKILWYKIMEYYYWRYTARLRKKHIQTKTENFHFVMTWFSFFFSISNYVSFHFI